MRDGLFPALLILVAATAGVACGDSVFTSIPTESDYVLVTEEFTQVPHATRDILWLIDNTGSMSEELTQLAPLFDSFISNLEDPYQISYQVGIILTDLDDGKGELQGIPWIITPNTEEAQKVFAANIGEIIDNPASLAPEEGLDAILTALSPELQEAGAPNYGFMREGTGLSIIAVSDADDSSELPGYDAEDGLDPDEAEAAEDAYAIDYYSQALIDLMGGSTPDKIIFSAIVGPSPYGCGALGGLFATPGTRYIGMANRLNGAVRSICSEDYSDMLEAIGAEQVVLKTTFPLRATPEADSINVWVNDMLEEEGSDWSYDESENAVTFTDEGTPSYGSKISVAYKSMS